jgi:hypothetical protein
MRNGLQRRVDNSYLERGSKCDCASGTKNPAHAPWRRSDVPPEREVMKRKSSRYRAMPFSARLVRPIENRHSNLFDLPSASGQPGVRAQKIFVIKQSRRLRSTNGADKTIRSILIFDNHPDSLRLVFGRRANPYIDLSAPERVDLVGANSCVDSNDGGVDRNVLAALLGFRQWNAKKGYSQVPSRHPPKQGERASLKRGITKSRERAMVMKHSGSDRET